MQSDLQDLRRDCASLSAAFFRGACGRVDVAELLRARGFDDLQRLREDPEVPVELAELARCADPLAEATAALGDLQVQSRHGLLAPSEALVELERTSDLQRMNAAATALDEAQVQALGSPLDRAYQALGATDRADVTLPCKLETLLEILWATGADPPRVRRLVRARLAAMPRPLEAWRGQWRPLLHSLLQPCGHSLGVASTDSATAPAAFAAWHDQRPDRLVVFHRPQASWSIARSFAAELGRALAAALGRAYLSTILAGLMSARLCAESLWRGADLSRTDARVAARAASHSVVRGLVRLTAFASAEELDARAWAASAGALLGELDDLPGALRFRGPWPDSLGFPRWRDRQACADLVQAVLRGVALDRTMIDAVGADWQRAPEAAETLLELVDAAIGAEVDGGALLAAMACL